VSAENDGRCSYAELARMAKDVASAIQLRCPGAQDRAAILLPTSIEFAAAFFGALSANAVVVPLDIHLKRADLSAIVRLTRPRILITSPSLYRKFGPDLLQTPICLLEFVGGAFSIRFVDPARGIEPGDSVGTPVHHSPVTCGPGGATSPEDDAVLILSSGTTGLPKAVRLSHRAILRNIEMHLESLGIEEELRGLQWLPMNYSYGLIACFLSILHSGGTAVLLSALDSASVLAAVDRYEVNLAMGTPALFQYLFEKAPTGSPFTASPLRYITVGGDRCRRYALDLICNRLPAARVFLTYGLTEAGPRVSTLPHHRVKDLSQSVGRPLNGVEVLVLDDNGETRGSNELGEIVVRTPSLMSGYFGDPERTREVIRNGLCHTGDIGYLDDGGYLYCLGRKDRQFKFGGRMVNPSVIEQCLSSHPLVQEVRVLKIESERDELICANIKARTARKDELLVELRRLCRKHMPSYLVPGEFHFEEHDHYYHKGRIMNLAAEAIPGEAVLQPSQRGAASTAV